MKDSSSLPHGEKPLKFPMGPTTSKPGPTLLIQAARAENVVIRSNPSKHSSKNETVNTIR